MSAITDEIIRVLGKAPAPLMASEIYALGQFEDMQPVYVALSDYAKKPNSAVMRERHDGNKFVYRLRPSAATAKSNPRDSVDIDKVYASIPQFNGSTPGPAVAQPTPVVAPKAHVTEPQPDPISDVLAMLHRKREAINVAIATLEEMKGRV